MCGIFGAVALAGGPLHHPECLARMAESLRHRGPDGERIVGHESARIGARRLAIMDLTTGEQPFQSPDRAVWMVCNGEIYNSPDLRREATGWGYPFRSRGDIENIVPFYERYGDGVVDRLDGMFGLAIWATAAGASSWRAIERARNRSSGHAWTARSVSRPRSKRCSRSPTNRAA